MIGKTSIGGSFGGCVSYQYEGHLDDKEKLDKETEVLEAVGVRDHSPQVMTRDFNRGRKLNSNLGKAVWHTSVSFNPDDTAKLTNELMLKVAKDYIEGMGLANTQYAIFRHNDRPHAHFHIIANRVDNDGKTISDSHNYKRSQYLCKALAEKHGLSPVPVGDLRPELSNPDRLEGLPRAKYEMRLAINQALDQCTSPKMLVAELKAQEIEVQIHTNSAGKETGISFKNGDYCVKGSDLERKLSLAGILKRLEAEKARQTAEAKRVADQKIAQEVPKQAAVDAKPMENRAARMAEKLRAAVLARGIAIDTAQAEYVLTGKLLVLSDLGKGIQIVNDAIQIGPLKQKQTPVANKPAAMAKKEEDQQDLKKPALEASRDTEKDKLTTNPQPPTVAPPTVSTQAKDSAASTKQPTKPEIATAQGKPVQATKPAATSQSVRTETGNTSQTNPKEKPGNDKVTLMSADELVRIARSAKNSTDFTAQLKKVGIERVINTEGKFCYGPGKQRWSEAAPGKPTPDSLYGKDLKQDKKKTPTIRR